MNGHVMSKQISLRQMQIHQKGTITTIAAAGELGRRIRDMGLVPNTEIEIVGKAPLKDPVALRLDHLRSREGLTQLMLAAQNFLKK